MHGKRPGSSSHTLHKSKGYVHLNKHIMFIQVHVCIFLSYSFFYNYMRNSYRFLVFYLNWLKYLSRIANSIQNNEDKVYNFRNPFIERSNIMDKYDIRPNDSSFNIIVSEITAHFHDTVMSLQKWDYSIRCCIYVYNLCVKTVPQYIIRYRI